MPKDHISITAYALITPAVQVFAQENVTFGTAGQVSVQGLAPGAYILRVEGAGYTHFTTLLKQ